LRGKKWKGHVFRVTRPKVVQGFTRNPEGWRQICWHEGVPGLADYEGKGEEEERLAVGRCGDSLLPELARPRGKMLEFPRQNGSIEERVVTEEETESRVHSGGEASSPGCLRYRWRESRGTSPQLTAEPTWGEQKRKLMRKGGQKNKNKKIERRPESPRGLLNPLRKPTIRKRNARGTTLSSRPCKSKENTAETNYELSEQVKKNLG